MHDKWAQLNSSLFVAVSYSIGKVNSIKNLPKICFVKQIGSTALRCSRILDLFRETLPESVWIVCVSLISVHVFGLIYHTKDK